MAQFINWQNENDSIHLYQWESDIFFAYSLKSVRNLETLKKNLRKKHTNFLFATAGFYSEFVFIE